MRETEYMKRMMVKLTGPGRWLFRNNVGQAETKTGRVIRFGLCKGSSDLIGWTERVIMPGMVGEKVAVFTALEVKARGTRVSKEQEAFIERVNKSGGIAKILREGDDE